MEEQCIFGSECGGYSNKPASSLSSTAHAVPLLPHGRRLGKVQPCSELLTKESSEQCTQKPSFPERGRTALAVGDSRQVRVIGRGSATKQSPLSLKEGGPLAVGDSRRVRVIGRVVQRRVFVCRFSRLAVQCIFGSECVGYSHEKASSLSSTASGPPPSTWKEAWGSASLWVYRMGRAFF